MNKKKFGIIFIILVFISNLMWAADTSNTPVPYDKNEFPSVFKDIRRAEIITLGAMPFITLNVSLGYTFGSYAYHGFDYDYFKNPFASGSDKDAFTQDEQIGILLTSMGICGAIGITDFIVHTVKRNNQKRRARLKKNGNITIEPIMNDPNATKLPAPEKPKQLETEQKESFESAESSEENPIEAESSLTTSENIIEVDVQVEEPFEQTTDTEKNKKKAKVIRKKGTE